jgi:hypothetical protein
MLSRSRINFVIDALMFMCVSLIAGIGLLIKYVLLPGQERDEVYGRNVDLYFMGMDRHEWGSIHLIIAYIAIGLLALHIILHWNMIKGMFRKLVANGKQRVIAAAVFLALCFAFAAFSFCINPEVREPERKGRNQPEISTPMNDARKVEQDNGRKEHQGTGSGLRASPIEVRGSMTLEEVSMEYHVPLEYLKQRLGLPAYVSARERLGRLRKSYEFRMSDVQRIILEYNEQQSHTGD